MSVLAEAAILTVGKSEAEFATITAALAACQNGDIISIIDNQVYDEAITISKSIILQGNVENRPTIQAPSTIAQDAAVILIQSPDVSLIGLTVDCRSLCWHGVYCWNTGIAVEGNTIINSLRNGIFCNSTGSNTRLIQNTILNHLRNGIYCWNTSSPEISNNLIQNNAKAIGCQNGSSPRIYRNVILQSDSIAIYTYDTVSRPEIGGSLSNANTIEAGDSGYVGTPSTRTDSLEARYNYWQTTDCREIRAGMDSMVQWQPFTDAAYSQILYCSNTIPVLIYPISSTIISALSVQLRWFRVPNTISYQLQVSTDSLFEQILFQDDAVSDTVKTIGSLVSNTRYFWRVKSQTAGAAGSWSDIGIFSTYGIQVVSPNGQENWIAGSNQTIRWRSTGEIRYTMIFFSLDNGKSYSFIGSTESPDSSYNWKLPTTSAEQCLIKVQDFSNEAVFDVSDRPFRISNDWIKLTRKSTSLRYLGHNDTIRWEFSGQYKELGLYLWDIKRQNKSILSSSVNPADKRYIWSIPTHFNLVEQGYLKIYSTTDSTIFDTMSYTIGRYNPLALFANPRLTALSHQSAEIRWTLSRPARCSLAYAEQPDRLKTLSPGKRDQNDYTAVLEGLQPLKTYYYRIRFTDTTGVRDSTGLYSFTTLRSYPAKSMPVSGKPEMLYIGQTIAVIRYPTDLPITGAGHLAYRNQIIQSKSDTTSSTRHLYYFDKLTAGTDYDFYPGTIQATGAPYIYPIAFAFRTSTGVDQSAPIMVSGPWVTATHNRACISFTTDEGCRSQISLTDNYSGIVVFQAENTDYLKEHLYSIMNLDPQTSYSFHLELTDPLGHLLQWNGEKSLLAKLNLEAFNDGNQFTTATQADLTPPRFSLPPHVIVRDDSLAILNWQSNEAAIYRLDLKNSGGETIAYSEGTLYQGRTQCPLTRLNPLSHYTAEISLIDLNDNLSVPRQLPFVTRKNATPVTAKLDAPPEVFTTSSAAVIRWTTDLACDARLLIHQTPQLELSGNRHFDNHIDQTHLVIIPQLQNKSLYYIQPQGYNFKEQRILEGRIDTIRIKSTSDQSGFVIQPFAAYTADSFMIIQWSTHSMTQSSIEFYPKEDTAARIELSNDEMRQNHSIPLMELVPQTSYVITVQSSDYAGRSSSFTFTQSTLGPAFKDQSAPDPVPRVDLSWDSSGCFIVNWEVSPSPDLLYYIVFRKTDQTEKLWMSNIRTTTLLDDDLIPETLYQYGVGAVDWFGNTSPIVYTQSATGIGADSDPADTPPWTATFSPNPCSDWISLNLNRFLPQASELSVYSILGRVIYHKAIRSDRIIIPTADWPAGLYLYRIRIPDQAHLTGKLMVIH